jgi:hypothetical protein
MSAETLARSAQVLREIHDLARLHGHEMPFGSRPWGAREINDAVGFRPPLFGERRNAVRPHGHVFAMAGACINLLGAAVTISSPAPPGGPATPTHHGVPPAVTPTFWRCPVRPRLPGFPPTTTCSPTQPG